MRRSGPGINYPSGPICLLEIFADPSFRIIRATVPAFLISPLCVKQVRLITDLLFVSSLPIISLYRETLQVRTDSYHGIL